MTLNEILVRCRGLQVHEVRNESTDYYEIVIYNSEVDKWCDALVGVLGPARKPRGVEPTEADLLLTEDSGGIRVNQTLFEKEFQRGTIVAKFWPWEDNIHTTLKMALLD
jgi:hypothetical protein